jgi:hypothetical protein
VPLSRTGGVADTDRIGEKDEEPPEFQESVLVSLTKSSLDLPILVGVTGHRDILPGSLASIQNAVRGALAALQADLGPSIVMMTALAEGADQVVAEIARELSIRMVAVIPMPLQSVPPNDGHC